ncbi:hypothetical protein KGA66_21335 [Actinocrinis puniceicyclus]|uniref:FtsK domain-containing protein n=1 Tax=Actinocrinis puniceicyclus TaxID=977794 RepID=A0A8J7WNF2_9ACTN|nr:FtsK/SpoIIIE domain-containing protein [Actinocrinis puniceicyclus]MBS2965608.1 hypothetical protein [Actinocrinis puniceicyclus]
MTQGARTADSMWTRLGRVLSGSPPVARLHTSLLRHPRIAKGRGMAHEGWSRVLDVCYPLIVLVRGTHRGATQLGSWWIGASREKRRLQTVIVLTCLIGVGVLKYGPLLLAGAFLAAVTWLGRDTSRKGADPESPEHIARLQAIYNGLVPYLQNGDDPDQHFKPGGRYRDAFTAWQFDEQDRLIRLRMDYSEYFRDGEPDSRSKVERALEGKIGHANEFLYAWDEEGNHLDVRILPPLPEGVSAQPWPVADIEFVLGVTDPGSASRLIPVLVADPGAGAPARDADPATREKVPPGFSMAQLAPVIWRLGAPGPNPHLLLAGAPASGKSTAVRSLLGQVLARGHAVAVIDTDQTAQYGALAGQRNVVRVTEDPADSLELLDWFGLEAERRAERTPAATARGDGASNFEWPAAVRADSPAGAGSDLDSAVPAEPPLWLFVDNLPELCAAAQRLGRPDPQDTLAALARKARFAGTTLVVTLRTDQVQAMRPALRNQLTTRVALGRVDPVSSTLLFGGTLELGGAQVMPPGRGYVRVGSGPVIRLQTPYAPALAPSAV